MLSVVGGTLVLGKSFQLLCHSDNGTLPITYTLHQPHMLSESRVVSKQGEQAIFNSSAIYKFSDLNSFLCHAKNRQNKPPMTGSGLLRSTIIGALDDDSFKQIDVNMVNYRSNVFYSMQSPCQNQC